MAFVNFLQSGSLRRNLIPAAVAVVIGGVAWIGIGPMLSGDRNAAVAPPPAAETAVAPEPPPVEAVPPEPLNPSVLVANRDIPAGMLLGPELLEWRASQTPVDVNLAVVEGVVSMRVVVGAVTRRPFRDGDMIAWDGLLMPGHQGFIGAVLRPGMRAVTVEVDRATTDANIIYPGDRVDVIMISTATSEAMGPASRTIIRDCRVLAVGASVLSLGRYGRVSLTQGGDVVPPEPPAGANYTLEVVPTDAERIAVAVSAGRITLAMRPITSPGATEAEGAPVRLREVMPAPPAPRTPEAPSPVRIIRGTAAAVASA